MSGMGGNLEIKPRSSPSGKRDLNRRRALSSHAAEEPGGTRYQIKKQPLRGKYEEECVSGGWLEHQQVVKAVAMGRK